MTVAEDLRGIDDVKAFANEPLTEPRSLIDAKIVTKGRDAWEKTRILYADATGELTAGLWESSPGAWSLHTIEDEYVRLLEGEIKLTDAKGATRTFKPGDSFFVPERFSGEWENIGTVRKVFVSMKRKRG